MRLLVVCPFFPWPPSNGSRILQSNLIKQAARSHRVWLFSLIQSESERKNEAGIASYCEEIVAVRPENQVPGELDGKRRAWDVPWGLVHRHPRHFYGVPSQNVVQALVQTLCKWQPDILLVNTLYMTNYLWQWLDNSSGVKKILIEHNVETSIQCQQVWVASSFSRRVRAWLYWLPFGRFEALACEKCDWVTTMSAQDRQLLLDLSPRLEPARVSVLPNGVDVASYAGDWGHPEPDNLIFPGALTYHANYDAMCFFLDEIFPSIRRANPRVTLQITGKTDGVDLSSLNLGEGVVLTGYLDDVRPAVARSWACVVPLRVGGGTRLKILEAMALGTPVVATSKGAEGLDVTPGHDILIADDQDQFANAVLQLLGDPVLRQKLALNGRKLVEALYDWQSIGERLNEVLETVKGIQHS
jgi:glycosyltransferase involved in cell wall biosynthesis